MVRVSSTVTFDAAKIAGLVPVQIRVVGMDRWTLRVLVAMWLIRFAGKIAGMNFEVIGPGDDRNS